MTIPTDRNAPSRKAALTKARQSRRPSRLGTPAGATLKPDYPVEDDAGFPGLLARTWRMATGARNLAAAVDTLLTLDGHVPAHIQLRALRPTEEAALKALCGVTWRAERSGEPPADDDTQPPAFVGELGLSTSGRLVVRVPSQGPLAGEVDLVDGVIRVGWPAAAVVRFHEEMGRMSARRWETVADCRRWLEEAGPAGCDELLDLLKDAALRTAPFVLYQDGKQYTNFRDRNTLTGKTLWPGHPDCALSSLQGIPLDLWSDNDVLLVVCLTLLVHSVGYGRIEEANGTQLSIDHLAHLLERTRLAYNSVPVGHPVPPAPSTRIDALNHLAVSLRERRQEIGKHVQLYREIHGPLMHKIERIAKPMGAAGRRRERAVCEQLSEFLPVRGDSLDELAKNLGAAPEWLAEPHGGFGTGLESAIYQTVAAAVRAFDADFAMSRGMRSLPSLLKALRAEDWEQLTKWELPDYFCCVIPAPRARQYFGDSPAHLADTAWAISSRMQYNSWHFVPGNVPKVPVVVARDYFVPPVIPDLAYHSDQHHHGHVAARVRYSIRSPQAVPVGGRMFNGFVDLRLLRCEGLPFDEQDLHAAQACSAFVAEATRLAAALVEAGTELEITSFDSLWHWETITGTPAPS